jgi:ABC-type polar amino acid transport system ATPase subunit
MANQLSGSRAQRQARAWRQLAMMAGAVAIARASDPETAAEVLEACRQVRP